MASSLRCPGRCFAGFLLAGLLMGVGLPPAEVAAAPSADLRLRAYATLVLADEARDQGAWETAHASYDEALGYYRALAEEDPAWQPEIVSYRVRYCTEQLAKLEPKLAPPEDAEAPPDEPAAMDETTRAHAEKIEALTRENAYLRRRLQGLEEDLQGLEEELEQQRAGAGGTEGGQEDTAAGGDAELRDAEAEVRDVKAAFDAYRVDMRATVSNLQSALTDARLDGEETRQANLDLIRQLEAAAGEHLRMTKALVEAGLDLPPAREDMPEGTGESEIPVEDDAVPEGDPAQADPAGGADEGGAEESAPHEAPAEGGADLSDTVPL